jgi:hypothetical protein
MLIEFTREGLFEEAIDTGEKGGEGLAGAGRRGNENVSPRLKAKLVAGPRWVCRQMM